MSKQDGASTGVMISATKGFTWAVDMILDFSLVVLVSDDFGIFWVL